MITFKLEGQKELDAQLKRMAASLGSDKVTQIMKDGANMAASEIKQAAPRGRTGNLRKGIKVKGLPTLFGYPPAAIVKSVAPHDHLVELGTKARFQKKTGKYVGVMPANPFFWPAWQSVQDKVRNYVVGKIKQMFEEQAK